MSAIQYPNSHKLERRSSKVIDLTRRPARKNGITPIKRVVLLAIAATLSLFAQDPAEQSQKERPTTVLVLMGEWFGDAYFPLKERLASCGWQQKRVGVDVEYRGCYKKARDIVLHSDVLIKDLKDFSAYDALIIPSGPQFRKFGDNPQVLQFIRDAHGAGLVVASFCTGNVLVLNAGLVDIPYGPELFPAKVTKVGPKLLIGPRGGGPPPGNGYLGAPIAEICDAVATELSVSCSNMESKD